MKCTLFLPYIDYYNTNFDVDDNYYSNGGYEKALKANDEMYKDSVYSFITNFEPLGQQNTFNSTISAFNGKVSKNEEKTSDSSCEASVYNEQMQEETIDGLKSYLRSQDVFILFIKLDYYTIEEEFESDLKMWFSSHNKINSVNASDEWKFQNEPKRNIRIKIDDFNADLINSKILEISNDGFVILVEKINYII